MTQTMPARSLPQAFVPAADGLHIYYLNPLLAGPLAGWDTWFGHIRRLGFNHVLVAPPFRPMRFGSLFLSATHAALHPDLDWNGDTNAGLAEMARLAEVHGLRMLLDVVLDRVADHSPLAEGDGPFSRPDTTLDPRQFDPDGDVAHAPLGEPQDVARLAAFWIERLGLWLDCGLAGFRFTSMRGIPPGLVRLIADGLSGRAAILIGWMAGIPIPALGGFRGCGLTHVFGSLPWWDGIGDWYWREAAALRRIAPLLTAAEAPFGPRAGEAETDLAHRTPLLRRRLALAALLGAGWMMAMGAEHGARRRLDPRRDQPDRAELRWSGGIDLQQVVCNLNATRVASPPLSANGEPRLLGAPGAPCLAVIRPMSADTRLSGDAALIEVNMTLKDAATPRSRHDANMGGSYDLPTDASAMLLPGDASVTLLHWHDGERQPGVDLGQAARAAAEAPRIAIEAISPSIDHGRFPARYTVGERVMVEADIICDGHDMLAAIVRWRGPGDDMGSWRETSMQPIGNDRWRGEFALSRLGVHEFTVEAWKDVYGTYRDELSKKFAAGLDVSLEVAEGRLLLEAAQRHSRTGSDDLGVILSAFATASASQRVAALLSDATAALMQRVDAHAFSTWIDPPFPVEAERTAARFASWYEIFPRSMSGDARRHGSFDDVIAQLPRIQSMGFDVLYFPPVHPIGKVNRKGPNNSLDAAPDDPGSPYGIADHMALHPELGSFDDFARLRDAAFEHGLEIALDFAVQCAPDHPWLTDHKGWFDWRPDGSIRYAENPPKKYQDIVNVDFYTPDAIDGLWRTLCDVVLFWCSHGIRIFRVDNPHTKPLPFWHWMIAEVRARHPDTLFLAEAFTKPKMMNRLAKVGFSQSYTYFTWRESKTELQDYMTELNTTAARDFFRPNFFVNTPDINPVFLQRSGRAGHLIRAGLAATLAGLWGVYSGFELCDATPLPGREEYLDSEKYQIRAWDWERPGNIVDEITRLNFIRRCNPALQTHLGITFLQSNNDRVLYFEKATADRDNVVLVAISLDAWTMQDSWFEVPLWRWQLPDWASVQADDLIHDVRIVWSGKIQHVRLDPSRLPYAIWRVRPV